MKPFLFENSVFETPTYFVIYCFAFLGALVLGSALARRKGLDPVRAIDLGIFSYVFGVLGARLFHIVFESPHYYLLHPLRVFYLWQGGFVLYGGLIGGIGAGLFYLQRQKLDWKVWGDLAAAPILCGISIGRVGCLAAGCCYGKATDLGWGLIFSDPRSAAPLHVSLHPTQILEFLVTLVLCVFFSMGYGTTAFSFFKKIQAGRLFLWALMSYAMLRFLIEFLRGDADRGLYFNGMFSTSQLISIVAFLFLFFVNRSLSRA